MGSYEEEYRRYYSDAKAKMNIKEEELEVEGFLKGSESKKIEVINSNDNRDIYPKRNYLYEDEVEPYNQEKRDSYLVENNYKEQVRGTYRGINNYNIMNGNRGSDVYSGRNYYGYSGGRDFNNGVEEKNMLGKLANKFIFQLAVTFVLFAAVITMKSIPNEESKQVYADCKEAIDKNFDYKEFIDDVKTVNIMEEVNKLKVNLKIDDSIKTGTEDIKETEPTIENIGEGVDSTSTNSSDKIDDNANQEKTN